MDVEVRLLSAALRREAAVHDRETVAAALALRELGLGPRRIAKRMDLPVATVRDWLAGRVPKHSRRLPGVSPPCEACGQTGHDFAALGEDYVYLLGLYLGDGSISSHHRGVYTLRITLDTRYPGIIESARAAVSQTRDGRVFVVRRRTENCVDVTSFWKSWPCLFPQHGRGPKHTRKIELTDWQDQLVERCPDHLLRGLIHSDGCRFINTGRNWTCPRYAFSQKSDDIRSIFCHACELVGVHWTRSGELNIYVSRKDDVAYLDTFIGPKQ
jgi:hypothetical protein